MKVAKLIVKKLADGYKFRYLKGSAKGIVAQINNLGQDNYHNVIGTFTIGTLEPKPLVICRGIRLSLSSFQSRASMAKYLSDLHDGDTQEPIPWDDIINQICDLTLKLYHAVGEIREIRADSKVKPLKYLVCPILPFGVPTIIFGKPGSGKSYIAVLLALVVQEPFCGDSLGLFALNKPVKALYLDFEFNESDLEVRWPALSKGFGKHQKSIHYLPCQVPLFEMANSMRKEIINGGYKLLILDSLLGAAGGNPNEAEPVLRLMNYLKSFGGVTALIIAHTSKGQTNGRKSTYGSVFYEAYARSVWECRSKQEPGEDVSVISLYHRKVNMSRKELPIGLKWTFNEDSITVVRCDLPKSKAADSSTKATQIIDLLNSKGRRKAKAIATELGEPDNEESIRGTLKRMQKKGEVQHYDDGTWGLPK